MGAAGDEPRDLHTVLLHERDQVNCDLLAEHLSGWDYLEVVGRSVSPGRSFELVRREEPDIVLAHAGAPDHGTLDLAKRLRALESDLDLVVFGVDSRVETTVEFLEAGASACVLEADGLAELGATLREVLDDRVSLPPRVGYRVTRRLSKLAEICERTGLDVGRLERLTPREHEVLRLLGERLSNREIADRLYIEVGTVKTHVHSILDKLEVSGREDAARYLLLVGDDEEC